jgi:hypothetical protein
VIAERKRLAVGLSDAALRAEDENFGAAQVRGTPTHPDILRPAEEVAAGSSYQVFRRDGQTPCWPRRKGLDPANIFNIRVKDTFGTQLSTAF